MTWRLQNQRSHIESATIVEYSGDYWLSYATTFGTHSGRYRSLKAAKIAFSKAAIQPRYHGKNIWKEE